MNMGINKTAISPLPVLEGNYDKYDILYEHISRLRVKDKRLIFSMMRTRPDITHDMFLPQYGFTIGEFAIFQILTENSRKRSNKANDL